MTFTCSVCDQQHDGLPAVTYRYPAIWDRLSEDERRAELRHGSDLAIWRDESFFVRCVLELPFTDREGVLEFGVWSTLSQENFKLYYDTFNDAEPSLPAMFGWFASELPDYPPTLDLKCTVHPRNNNQRPLIELEPTDHPLAVHQREGVTFEHALAYVHARGFLD